MGKTSLLRAMAREIAAGERVGTLESEYELFLHELDGGPTVVAYEAREGNGERSADGRMAGELTLSDLFPQLLRMSLRRVIVGEVRSIEVVPMLHAMNEGEGGSMCTVHARTAHSVVERLVTLCLEAGIGMTEALAHRLIANAVDFIVYVRLVDETEVGAASGGSSPTSSRSPAWARAAAPRCRPCSAPRRKPGAANRGPCRCWRRCACPTWNAQGSTAAGCSSPSAPGPAT
ncbi:ATPase, T2SS/T4P/T4SS family [Streptacidiphilus monticola]